MTDLRAAAQQFVSDYENGDLGDLKHYARALRAALAQQEPRNQCGETCERAKLCAVCARGLAQQEQEPVAWSPALTYPNYEKERVWLNGKPRQEDVEYWSKNGNGSTYGYTTPPRREWQSLSEAEVKACLRIPAGRDELTRLEFARAIEAALKEKNA